MLSDQDRRYLNACLRYARRHRGRTGTNPSVGCLFVKDDVIVGRGMTALGGRPHAERVAIDSRTQPIEGSTAYVSLEPCAHHGATPPCAQALIDARVKRVVTAWTDPDHRVDGRGHAMLREAGIEVDIDEMDNSAPHDLRGYLNRKQKNRPQVTLKLAVSADGKLGKKDEETPITGPVSRSMVHRLRAEHDGILVGRGTVETDNPELTCRLPGLQHRSPHRFVLDSNACLNPKSNLALSAGSVPVSIITSEPQIDPALTQLNVNLFPAESHSGQLALPEILEDMAARGLSSLMVEGGPEVATSFLDADLVDEIHLFQGKGTIGDGGVLSPITNDSVPNTFAVARRLELGDDSLTIFFRK